MELDKLHIRHPATRPPTHGDARRRWRCPVSGIKVYLAGAATGQDGVMGGDGLDFIQQLIQRIHAITALAGLPSLAEVIKSMAM